jgi:hypothetical protein
MTIPLSPASDRRGPRETLLALAEAYLRHGGLPVADRHSVVALADRVRRSAAGVRGQYAPLGTGQGRTDSLGTDPHAAAFDGIEPAPEWAPLAAALAAMLRGEAEGAVRLVGEALGARDFPDALRPALLGIGIRGALAADRPALAARWRAGLRIRLERAARSDDLGGEGGEGVVRILGDAAVLASLPEPIRELLGDDVYDAGHGAGYGAGHDNAQPGVRAAPGVEGDGEGDGEREGDGTRGSAGDGMEGRGPARVGGGDGGLGEPAPAGETTLHLVTDPYHGDVVSVPARVEVVRVDPGLPWDDLDAPPDGVGGSGTGMAGPAPGNGSGAALPRLTVRVHASAELPPPPASHTWHVRFVGRARALDARSSDGSLLEFVWRDHGLVVTLQPPDWFEELGVEPAVLATRVTHVVVVPELMNPSDEEVPTP